MDVKDDPIADKSVLQFFSIATVSAMYFILFIIIVMILLSIALIAELSRGRKRGNVSEYKSLCVYSCKFRKCQYRQ